MENQPGTELALVEAPNRIASADPGTHSASESETVGAKAAFRRCCAAWQRSFKAYMDEEDGDTGNSTDIYLASKLAAPAYCNAMPMLSGYEGIRDFIACAAHGIAIEAISLEKGAQLLYAAQVAMSLSQPSLRLPKMPQPTKSRR